LLQLSTAAENDPTVPNWVSGLVSDHATRDRRLLREHRVNRDASCEECQNRAFHADLDEPVIQ
jgi:hypothetical protein